MRADVVRGTLARFPHTAAAALLVFALQFVHGPAGFFLYDAAQYWGAPVAMLSGGDVIAAGALQMRGVLTTLVYLPPAMVSAVLGPESAPWTVLVWNALLAAGLCAVLLPRIAGLLVPSASVWRIWLSAVVGGALLSGFARYPLLDVWSVAIALAGFLLLAGGTRWWSALLAGLAFGVAINLRPTYLVPIAIGAAVLLAARPRRVALALPGALLALVPQFVLNATTWAVWSPLPVATANLSAVQAEPATFTIRYDTVVQADRSPRQFYCDPAYAALLDGDPPAHDQVDVVTSALNHLPQSLWFLTQKVSASLHWSFATPYEHAPGPGTSAMAFLVIAVAALGLVALVVRAITARGRGQRVTVLALLGFWLGAVGTVAFSTPETRFAISIVLIGLVGVLTMVPEAGEPRPAGRTALIGVLVAIALAVLLLVAGRAGLDHPMPPGELPDSASCAVHDQAG